jgi:hypothetical protein
MNYLSARTIRSAASILICFVSVLAVSAQRRDFLTEQEVEIIRDTQDIDERITALTRMIDRRFHALGINVNGWKEPAKTSETWGEPPAGTRAELLTDIRKILQKAVDDIDNLAANPNAAPIREKGDKRAKKDPGRFPNAVRDLAAAAGRYLGPLKAEMDRSKDDREKGAIIGSVELCDQIIEAVAKLPAEVRKSKS